MYDYNKLLIPLCNQVVGSVLVVVLVQLWFVFTGKPFDFTICSIFVLFKKTPLFVHKWRHGHRKDRANSFVKTASNKALGVGAGWLQIVQSCVPSFMEDRLLLALKKLKLYCCLTMRHFKDFVIIIFPF